MPRPSPAHHLLPARHLIRTLTVWVLWSGASQTLAAEPPAFQVNEITPYFQSWAAVGAQPDGSFLVVWLDNETATGLSPSIQGRHFSVGAVPTGGQQRLDELEPSSLEAPSVAALPNGEFVVAWSSYGTDAADGSSTQVYGRLVESDGQSSGGAFRVDTGLNNYAYRTRVAADAAGGFLIVWENVIDMGGPLTVAGRGFAADGLPIGEAFQVNAFPNGSPGAPAVGAGPSGYVVAWESNFSTGSDQSLRSIQARRLGLDLVPLGLEFQVNVTTSGNQVRPEVVVLDSGDFVITWEDRDGGAEPTIRARRFDSAGAALGEEWLVAADGLVDDMAGLAPSLDGGFAVTWRQVTMEGSSIVALDHDETGTARGAPVLVRSGSHARPALAHAGQRHIAVWHGSDSPGDDDSDTSIQGRLVAFALFCDGFESGELGAWSGASP